MDSTTTFDAILNAVAVLARRCTRRSDHDELRRIVDILTRLHDQGEPPPGASNRAIHYWEDRIALWLTIAEAAAVLVARLRAKQDQHELRHIAEALEVALDDARKRRPTQQRLDKSA